MSRPEVGRLVAAAPLAVALLWLPLRGGGSDPIPLAIAEALALLAVGILAASGWMRFPTRSLWGSTGVLVAVGASVLFGAISTAISPDLDAGVPLLIQWLFFGAVALLTISLTSSTWTRLLLGAVLVAGVTQAAYGFFSWWGGGTAAPVQSGTFFAPNQYAGYLAISAPIFASAALLLPKKREAAAYSIFGIVIYLAIALSASRGGAVAAGFGLVLVAILAIRHGGRGAFGRIALLLVALVAAGGLVTYRALLPDEPISRAGALRGLEEKGTDPATLRMRFYWAQGSMLIWAQKPLTGTGLGTFGDKLIQVQDPVWAWSKFAHNQYMEALGEGGIGMMLAAFAIPLLALRSGFRSFKSAEGRELVWKIGLTSGVASAMLHSAIDHDWSFPAFPVAFIVAALLLCRPLESAIEDVPVTSKFARFALSGVALASAIICVTGAIGMRSLVRDFRPVTDANTLQAARTLAPYRTLPRRQIAEQLLLKGTREGQQAAARELETAVALDELDPTLRWRLAEVQRMLGDNNRARSIYLDSISTARNSSASYSRLALFELTDGGDLALAATVIDEGISRLLMRPSRPRLAPSIAQLYLIRSQVEEKLRGPLLALPYALEAADIYPAAPQPWLRSAELTCRNGDPGGAAKLASIAMEKGAEPASLADLHRLISMGCS